MNLRVPKHAGKFLNSCTTGGFSRRAQLHEIRLHNRCAFREKIVVLLYSFLLLVIHLLENNAVER
jgi:hypothetical protein